MPHRRATLPGVSAMPTVGASGAIAGILGAYIVLFPRAMVTVVPGIFFFWSFRLPAVAVLLVWFLSQFRIGLGSQAAGGGGVAWMAHVGGFVSGVILVLLVGGPAKRDRIRYSTM